MEYRPLRMEEIRRETFRHFSRRQEVTLLWRKVDGEWQIQPVSFIDDWDEADYATLVSCLRGTLEKGGVVFGAFEEGALKGFASVEEPPLGSRGQYRDLTSLHVSADRRGRGAGRRLFTLATDWARERGTEKLYISSHSAAETQAFYEAMGCVDAEECQAIHTEKEPLDRQLELVLSPPSPAGKGSGKPERT